MSDVYFKWRYDPHRSALNIFRTDIISECWSYSFEVLYWSSFSLFQSMNPAIFSIEGFSSISATTAFLFISFVYRILNSNISSGCRTDSATLELSSGKASEKQNSM